MATQKPKNVYACTMAELYTICRMGWNSFLANLAEFTEFLTIYTAQYGQDALDEIDAAEAMPEFQERNEQAELALVELRKQGKLGLKRWKSLRNYIRASFPEDDRKAKWESAGSDHYEKASNMNWSELRNMLTAGKNFLTLNDAALLAGGMPTTFVASYDLVRSAFNDALVAFTNLEQDEVEGTDLKVIANNALYNKLMDMFEDGTLIFEDVPAKRERFIFAHLKEIITNTGGGGGTSTDIVFDGMMVDGSTDIGVANQSFTARLEGVTEDIIVETDSVGKFNFSFTDIAVGFVGTCVVNATVPGFDPFSATFPVEAGQLLTGNITLTPFTPVP